MINNQENSQSQLELIVKIAEMQLQSNLISEKERSNARVRITVAQHKIKELERLFINSKKSEIKIKAIPMIIKIMGSIITILGGFWTVIEIGKFYHFW